MLFVFAIPLAMAAPFGPGTRVRLDEIGPDDGFYAHREALAGVMCRSETALQPSVGDWFAGKVACDNGNSYSFYELKFTVASAPATNAPDHLPGGSTVLVRGISMQDAYKAQEATYVGARCTTTTPIDKVDGWFSAVLACDNGERPNFYQVALEVVGVGTGGETVLGKPGIQGKKLKNGTPVRIVGLHRADPVSAQFSQYDGLECRVRRKLTSMDDGWWAGTLRCGDADTTFVAVGVEPL
jgi:hypothetical protein